MAKLTPVPEKLSSLKPKRRFTIHHLNLLLILGSIALNIFVLHKLGIF